MFVGCTSTPADTRKEGPVYDLPIAVGLLLAAQVIQTARHKRLLFAGELALDGRLRPINGVINLAILAKRLGVEGVVVPTDNAEEARAVDGIEVYPMDALSSVVGFLNGTHEVEPLGPVAIDHELQRAHAAIDFADVRGQEAVKRALTIAAAG
ncbi:MAG: magnesium chelatase domain-containing protein, partial [Planctomycetota bacterium]